MVMFFKLLFLMFGISALGFLAANWILFEKQNIAGWKSLVPGYNIILLNKIAGQTQINAWLMFIPFLNVFSFFQINKELRKKYAAPAGFEFGMTFFFWAFYPLFAVKVMEYQEISGEHVYFGPKPFYGPKQFKNIAEDSKTKAA